LLFKSVGGIFLGIPLLIFAGDLIVKSSVFFTNYFDIQIAIFGVFIVALGTSLPELFFIITAAKRQNDWLALGGIIGDVIVLSTFGLGFIVVISPIKIVLFSSFIPIFIFLVIASFLFFFFIKSEKRIDSKEAIALLFVYFAFILSKIISYFLG
jgi:cation:H+ antiporter